MKRLLLIPIAMLAVAGVILPAAPEFLSVWKSPDAAQVSFLGAKVATLVITQDETLRIAGEEVLMRELNKIGVKATATYRLAPKEEMQNADRAKVWYERAGVEGVVAVRPVSNEKRLNYNSSLWMSPSYNTFWGYYGYGYSTAYVIGSVDRDTVITAETLIFSVSKNQLLWAAVTETRNPKTLHRFIEDLVKASAKQLQSQGLARALPKK
jgi:hypothetical protein